jgi:hypothetical protein
MSVLAPQQDGQIAELRPPANATVEELIAVSLLRQLEERAPLIDLYEDYYEGRHRLSFISTPYRKHFGQMLAAASENWMALVVKSPVERMSVQGFVAGEGDNADLNRAASDLWQRNGLDQDQVLGYTESAKIGESYLLVQPDPADPRAARITLEHPRQMIVQRSAMDRRRLVAALKVWWDDADGALQLTLWTTDEILRFRRPLDRAWIEERTDYPVEPNRFGRVPVFPLVNDPGMLPALPPTALLTSPHAAPAVPIGLGRSDLADVISTQDVIDQLLTGLLVSSETSAYKQRWATGLELPTDPETGQTIEPFRAAVDRLWVGTSKDTQFGQFEATDLKVYTEAIQWNVQSIASRTRIPPHVLMSGSGNWPSGESLRAAESGLVSKVQEKMRSYGPAVSAAIALGLEHEGQTLEWVNVVWEDPERRIDSEHADSLVKKLALGVPPQQLWRELGYSPDTIDGFSRLLREAREAGIVPATGGATPPAISTPPPVSSP